MRKILEEIAEEENGSYTYEEETLPQSSWGESTEEGHHKLQIEYKGIKIRLIFTTKTHCLAQVEFILPTQENKLTFEMTTKSPLMSLFFRRKNPIQVKTKDPELKQYLEEHPGFESMNEKAKAYAFEPFIVGKNTINGYLVRTEFHLQFPERTEVVRPLILFYKGLIDRLVK